MKSHRLTTFLIAALAGTLSVATARAEGLWLTDFSAAKAQAVQEHKKLLIDFTGSDWCAACNHLKREIFSTPEFSAFTADFILVRLDYPRKNNQPPNEKAQNAELKDKFRIEAYPTVIMADASGREITRRVGYRPGSGVAEYLAQLKAVPADPLRTN